MRRTAALMVIVAGWTFCGLCKKSKQSAERRQLIEVAAVQAGVTMLDDNATDTLTGEGGRDWFFEFPDDVLPELFRNELKS